MTIFRFHYHGFTNPIFGMTTSDDTPKEIRAVIDDASKDLLKAAYIFTLPARIADSNLHEVALVNHMSRRFGRKRRHPVAEQYSRKLVKQSDAERDAGFPTIANLAIGHLWSFLESYSRDMVAAWLKESMQFDPALVSRLRKDDSKIPDEASWQDDDLDYWQHLAIYLRDRARYRQHLGIERFERWFAAIGLGDSLISPYLTHRHGQQLGRDLTELHQIRNCLFHHRGLVDRRTRDNCPWLRLEIGHQVQPTIDEATRYYLSSVTYLMLTRNRVCERFDLANWFNPDDFWAVCNLDSESWVSDIARILVAPGNYSAAKSVREAFERIVP